MIFKPCDRRSYCLNPTLDLYIQDLRYSLIAYMTSNSALYDRFSIAFALIHVGPVNVLLALCVSVHRGVEQYQTHLKSNFRIARVCA